jgi:hypothetical protein
MAGFQIPTTEEGEIRKKRKIGHIWSETDFLNIFALRGNGNFVESFQGGDRGDTSLTLPQEIELYLAGTFNQWVSYFFELENETREIQGTSTGSFEEKSRFGIGREFFLMFDLQHIVKNPFSQNGKQEMEMMHPQEGMLMGPMVMVGRIDPSTNFSYPTNRQYLLNVPGRVVSGQIERLSLTPYAFSSKFFVMKTGDEEPIEVTREALYNTKGDFGIDVHAMVGSLMFQFGLLQGLSAGAEDVNQKKDPYFLARMNFGSERYVSGSLSGLLYWGEDTGRVSRTEGALDTVLIDWLRYGIAGNIKYELLDIYGAFIWDRIQDLPAETRAVFDDTAFGFTIEGDYLASDRLLLSIRYDQLNAGGFTGQKANGKVFSLQSRLYVRDNFSLYIRDSVNLAKVSSNGLQNFRNLIALGVDFDF